MPWQCTCIVQKQTNLIKNLPLSHARSCPLTSFILSFSCAVTFCVCVCVCVCIPACAVMCLCVCVCVFVLSVRERGLSPRHALTLLFSLFLMHTHTHTHTHTIVFCLYSDGSAIVSGGSHRHGDLHTNATPHQSRRR